MQIRFDRFDRFGEFAAVCSLLFLTKEQPCRVNVNATLLLEMDVAWLERVELWS